MGRLLRIFLITVLAIATWSVFVAVGTREGWWRPLPAPSGDARAFFAYAKNRIGRTLNGDAALTVIQGGRVIGEYFVSRGRPIDRDSLFQVASLSKWITAWGVMTLVEQHRIDLDAPVERYLKRWKLPPSSFDNKAVTVRRLLSHTAGLTDGLGFRGFPPGVATQTLPQALTRAADHMEFASGIVRVGMQPGSAWRYSGGGYMLLQLLIEDVTGESFNHYMRRAVLLPLGMKASTYVDPDPGRVADFFDENGAHAIHYKFTALAAASLYTSTADLTRFLEAQTSGPHGEPIGRGVLSPATVLLMRRPQAFLYWIPVWGLGTVLYAPTSDGFVVGHDGENFPAINTTARTDPAMGDGIIMLDTGSATLASSIGGEWTYWHTGVVDLALMIFEAQRTILIIAIGAAVIVLVAGAVAWRGRGRTRADA